MSDVIFLSILSALLLLVLLAFTYGLYFLLNKQLDREKRSRIQMVLDAQEKERDAIAAEVHDHLTPLLSIIRMQAEALAEKDTGEPVKTALQKMTDQLRQATNVCREISYSLSPNFNSKTSFSQMIEERVEHIRKYKAITIDFHTGCTAQQLHPSKAASLFRIVSELFENTLRHSGASAITIDVSCNANSLRIFYADDGKGLPPEGAARTMGHGIRNMKSRTELLNGNWRQLDRLSGYALELTFPMKELVFYDNINR